MLKLPTFILAGANTSGTTSLHDYLRQHPQIFMSRIKEPTFFAAADMLARDAFVRPITRDRAALAAFLAGPQNRPARYWVSEWDQYVRLFRDVRDHIAIGESSASYFWLPSAAAAIKARLPEVRLIFVLRHPAERLFSWYVMHLARDPALTFRAWFTAARAAGGDGGPSDGRYTLPLDGGWTGANVQRFLDHFPREQLRFYRYESYLADAPALLRDLFAFLGVDPNQQIDMSYRLNETLVPRFPLLDRLRRRVLGRTPLTTWLPAAVATPLRRWYRRRRRASSMDPGDRQLVLDVYRDDIRRTADLIGHDLSSWLT